MDARDWDERYSTSALVWSAGPNQFVASALAGLAPGRALDLAAGEGRNAIWLASVGWRVTAVDYSAVAVARGRELAEARADAADLHIDWVVADALTFAAPGEFDLALLSYLQLPGPERGAALRNAFASLRPGGRLFVVAHDSSNLTEGVGGPKDPAVLYTAEDVLADLDGLGFEVLTAERVARVVPTADAGPGEPAEQTAYDALVHLVRAG